MNLKKLFSFVLVFLFFGMVTQAQVYVSATNGDDTFGTGAQATPYRSIQKAINVAATGSTIYVEAGVYNSIVIPTEGAPVTLAAARSFTFVGTAVGLNTTVEITDGFTLNHASAVADFQTVGTATFNFGSTATALVLTAGSMNIATANVTLGSGATMTVGDGLLNTLPTKGTNLNVIFNGANAVSSTAAYLPSSLGTGTITISKATGALTVDNTTLSTAAVNITTNVNVTFGGSLTVAANGDITNGGTGTLTIGNDASSTLAMSSTSAGSGQIIVNAGGTVTVNSNVSYSVRNAGTSATAASSASYDAGNFVAITAGNLTINGNLTLNNTNIAAVNGDNAVSNTVTLSNAGTGSLSVVGTILTPLASTTFADVTADAPTTNQAYINVILSNTSTGSLSTRTAATRGVTGTNGVINNGGGTMTLGLAGDTFSTGYDVVNGSAAATEVMTVNATATFGGTFTTVNAASLTEFKANASIAGVLTHAGLMKINANTLTLSNTGAAAFVGAGKIYSTTAATVGSGVVKFTGAAPVATYTGELPNVEATKALTLAGNMVYGNLVTSGTGSVTIAGGSDVKGNLEVGGSGTITVNGATTVRGNVNMTAGDVTMGAAGLTVEGTFTMPQGTFTFGANTLTLKGNFVRTGGTIDAAAAGTGTLAFAGAASQTFTPGTQMNVYNVTVTNTGTYLANVVEDDKVTINASLIVLNDFTITTGKVVLGSSNIRMQQTGGSARFTNGGRGYSASGIGGLIFEGNGANAAGGGNGAVITGAQPYSNIYVRLSVPANNVFALGAVKISGVVTLDGGGIIWNAADDVDLFSSSTLTLDDALVVPTVVINTQNTHGSPFLVDGADGGAVALAITSVYNLTYSGQTATTMTTTDFITGKVKDLTLSAGTAGKTITFIAGPGAITGNLTVDNGETLQLTNGGAQTLTASGNTAAHVVNGTVTGGVLAITGNAASLSGGSGTGNASSIADLQVAPAGAGSFTSTGMKVFTNLTLNQTNLVSTITMNSATATVGTFVNTAGTTTLNMNSTASSVAGNFTVTAGAVTLTMNGGAAGTRTIAGNLAVNGGSLTLGSHINVTGAAAQAGAGSLALGNYNLTLADAYTHAGTGTITAGTGAVVANVGATKNYTFTSAVDIPNFTLNSPGFGVVFVTNGLNVTNKFVHTAGDLDLNSLPLTISGDAYTYTAGTYTNTGAAATGVVNLTGAALTVTAAGSPVYPFVNVNSTGTVTLASSSTTTPRNFTVSTAFTHTKGNIVLGFNDLLLTDNGAANASYTTVATAGTVTGTATGANLGEVVFNGAIVANHTLTMADNYSVQNIKVATATIKGGTKVLTVSDNFTLGADFTFANSARLVLGDGANIIRSAGVFDEVPTFGTTVNVEYNPAGVLASAKEIPAATNVLNNLTITSGAPALSANATVNGTLYLNGGTISDGGKALTIVEGGTINRSGGAFAAAGDNPVVTNYKLVYSGAGAIVIGNEFVNSATAVTSLTVSMTGAGVLLNADRTVGSFTMSPTGAGAAAVYFAVGTDAATRTFTVTGPTTINNGIVSTQDATAAASTSASAFVVQGSVAVNGGTFGSLGADDAAGVDGGLNLTFGGAVSQDITLSGNTTIPNLTINSTGTTAADATINVTGGDLTITNLLTFENGILNMGTKTLYLPRPQVAANGGLGFDRSGVAAGEFGHVVGKISRPAATGDGTAGTNGRFEFPVGSETGMYRPAIITFTPAYVVTSPVSIVVSSVNESPEGVKGLESGLDGGNGIVIGGYPQFYWLVTALPSGLTHTQQFDIELRASNIGYPVTNANDLRIIRRQDGQADANTWTMQGAWTGYNNYMNVVGTDTNVVVRTNSSSGGLVAESSRFTFGLPSRVPIFTVPVDPLTLAATENAVTTAQFTAVPQNVSETVTYSLLPGAPAWVAINAATGLVTFTLTDNYTAGGATYDFTVRATTSTSLTKDLAAKVVVANANRAPVIVNAIANNTSMPINVPVSVLFTATDPDAQTPTWSIVGGVSGNMAITAAGVFTWTPAIAEIGDHAITVRASDGDAVPMTDDTTFTVTVDYGRVKGDVDAVNGVTQADAVPVLQYAVGLEPGFTLINGSAINFWAADVSGGNPGEDGAVTAYDAASILYSFVTPGNPFLPKKGATLAEVAYGKMTGDENIVRVPVQITNTSNVVSAEMTYEFDANVAEIVGVNTNAPSGWLTYHNVADGKVKVVMAGIEPLTDGNVLVLDVKMKDKESSFVLKGGVQLNADLNVTMENVSLRQIPTSFEVSQNYPNPFNPTTEIKYQISENTKVMLKVYNTLGQEVATIVNNIQEAGYYTAKWDGTNNYGQRVTSGVYIYRLQAGNFIATKKMNLIK